MDFRIFLAVFVYLFISTGVAGLLPSEIYTGTRIDTVEEGDIQEVTQTSATDVETLGEQLNFIEKIMRFLFVTWSIEDIPVIIALILQLFNLMSITIVIIYAINLIRGSG